MKNFIQNLKNTTLLFCVGLLLNNIIINSATDPRPEQQGQRRSWSSYFGFKTQPKQAGPGPEQESERKETEETGKKTTPASNLMTEKEILNNIRVQNDKMKPAFYQIENIKKSAQHIKDEARKKEILQQASFNRQDALNVLNNITQSAVIKNAAQFIIQNASGDKIFIGDNKSDGPSQHLLYFNDALNKLHDKLREAQVTTQQVGPMKANLIKQKNLLDADLKSLNKEIILMPAKRSARDVFRAIHNLIDTAMWPISSLYELEKPSGETSARQSRERIGVRLPGMEKQSEIETESGKGTIKERTQRFEKEHRALPSATKQ